MIAILSGCLSLVSSLLSAETGPPLELNQGPVVSARLLGLTEQGAFRFALTNESREYPPESIISWGHMPDRPCAVRIFLTDGGMLSGDDVRWESRRWRLENRSVGVTLIGADFVRAVLVESPADPLERDALLNRIAASVAEKDQIWLHNGDVMRGQLERSTLVPDNRSSPRTANQESTPTGEVAASIAIRLGPATKPLLVPFERIRAIVSGTQFAPRVTLPAKWFAVGWRDGSLLHVRSLRLANRRVKIQLVSGWEMELPHEDFTRTVCFLQPLGFGAEFLSDREPLGYKHIPFLEQSWPYHKDLCVAGSPLRTQGAIWPKGIGMHSTSRLAYELSSSHRRFVATIAVDDRAAGKGSVIFRAFVARGDSAATTESWEQVFASPILRGGDPPLRVECDIADAKRLALVVEFADYGDVCDYADWINARVVP